LDDFTLASVCLLTDIDVQNRGVTAHYITAFHRIGKVKGFTPPRKSWLGDDVSFCLEGNSNGVEFLICDLESLCRKRLDDDGSERKYLKELAKISEGILRAEVRLVKANAIRACTDSYHLSEQIAAIFGKGQKIFGEVFTHIIPYGDIHKKDKALEIVKDKVVKNKLKWRMMRLVGLVPEKKSLLLAQKGLSYQHIDELMAEFAELGLSPVTLSRRHDVKSLKNIYDYLLDSKGEDDHE
jgi:hypothetical protein